MPFWDAGAVTTRRAAGPDWLCDLLGMKEVISEQSQHGLSSNDGSSRAKDRFILTRSNVLRRGTGRGVCSMPIDAETSST